MHSALAFFVVPTNPPYMGRMDRYKEEKNGITVEKSEIVNRKWQIICTFAQNY